MSEISSESTDKFFDQLLAQIQCVVSEAIVYAAPQPVSDLEVLAKLYMET